MLNAYYAVQCAVEIQGVLRVRNIAARLEGLAESGGICISSEVHSQVRSRMGLDFEDLSELAVKNIPEPVHHVGLPG